MFGYKKKYEELKEQYGESIERILKSQDEILESVKQKGEKKNANLEKDNAALMLEVIDLRSNSKKAIDELNKKLAEKEEARRKAAGKLGGMQTEINKLKNEKKRLIAIVNELESDKKKQKQMKDAGSPKEYLRHERRK